MEGAPSVWGGCERSGVRAARESQEETGRWFPRVHSEALALEAYQWGRTQPALGAVSPSSWLSPHPSPEQAPLQKVSLAQNSRYYLSCPMESRHATYSWRHENSVEQSCEPGHQSPNCILFIENLTDLQYGHYYCEAQEGSYLHEAQHWQLLREDGAMTSHLLGRARALAASLWLGVLPTLTLGLLVH